MQQVPAGGIPIVDPDQSQYVTQQVSPVTYQLSIQVHKAQYHKHL